MHYHSKRHTTSGESSPENLKELQAFFQIGSLSHAPSRDRTGSLSSLWVKELTQIVERKGGEEDADIPKDDSRVDEGLQGPRPLVCCAACQHAKADAASTKQSHI